VSFEFTNDFRVVPTDCTVNNVIGRTNVSDIACSNTGLITLLRELLLEDEDLPDGGTVVAFMALANITHNQPASLRLLPTPRLHHVRAFGYFIFQ
jgi:hypothetical protein